jgi:hypothetical protein
MSSIYELIGRLVVRVAWLRFGRQIKIAGGAFALLAVVGAYLIARHSPPEG